MDNFSAYWKIAAVTFAGVFAILGAYFDVRDRKTDKITSWGRIFFALTILSVIGGLYAQWTESAVDKRKNELSQNRMLRILGDTDRNVYDLSRLLQPLDKAEITVFLSPDCNASALRRFCRAMSNEAEAEDARSPLTGESSFEIRRPNWRLFPDPVLSIDVYIFKKPTDAHRFFNSGLVGCDWCGDISFPVLNIVGPKNREEHPSWFYDTRKKSL